MSKHFSFRRFGLLFRKHTIEQYKTYLMAFATLTGILLLLTGYVAYMENAPLSIDIQTFIYMLPLLLAGAIFTSGVFAALGDTKRAIASLTLPASHLEKYVVGWLYSFVFFVIFYTISFYMVLLVVLEMDNSNGQEVQLINIFSDNIFTNILGAYALVHAVALLGSVYFEKVHFIKTAFVFFAFMVVLVFLNKQVLKLFINEENLSAFPFSGISFMEGENVLRVAAPDAFNDWTGTIIPLILCLLLWLAAYARLREKQV